MKSTSSRKQRNRRHCLTSDHKLSSASNHHAAMVKMLTGEEEYNIRENSRDANGTLILNNTNETHDKCHIVNIGAEEKLDIDIDHVLQSKSDSSCFTGTSKSQGDYRQQVMNVNTTKQPNQSQLKVEKVLETFSSANMRKPSRPKLQTGTSEDNLSTTVDLIG